MSETLPTRWEDELERYGKEVALLERPSLSQISLRAGVMTYQGVAVPGNKLECIVAASVFENRWFENKFDPNKRENPQCFALSVEGKDMVPHEDSPKRQSEDCASCPQFEWGSAGGGSRGKACKQVRRLALLPAAFLKEADPEKVKAVEMALMSIPVTSARNWANYVTQVFNEYKRPPWAVLTEIRVEPDARTQFQVKFRAITTVSEDYLDALLTRANSAKDILMAPYDYSGQGEDSAPVAKPSKEGKKY